MKHIGNINRIISSGLTVVFLYIPIVLLFSGRVYADPIAIWISQSEIDALPMSGDPECSVSCEAAWNDLLSRAGQALSTPNISNQDETVGVHVLGKALVYARTGNINQRNDVLQALHSVIDTEKAVPGNPNELQARALAVGRKLPAYVMAADIINLEQVDPIFEEDVWRPWLYELLTENLSGYTLISCHQERPNDWGTHCGAGLSIKL